MMNKYRLVLVSLTALSLTLSACGGSSATQQPSTGNIPNLAKRPAPKASQLKTLKLSGKVFDQETQEPVDKAVIWFHLLEAKGAAKKNKPGARAQKPTPPPQPGATPSAVSTPAPTISAPAVLPSSGASVSGATPVPNSNVSPSPSSDVDPNVIASPSPSVSPSAAVDGVVSPPSVSPAGQDAHLPYRVANVYANVSAFQLAQAASNKKESPNIFRTTSNGKGEFWIDEVPDGTYMMTVIAPYYRTFTVVNISPAQLDVPLVSTRDEGHTDVTGMVLSPNETPVSHAKVSASYQLGREITIPSKTNALGEFVIPQLAFGKHDILSYVMDGDHLITQMGLLKDVHVTTKSLKVTQPVFGDPNTAPTPDPEAGTKTRDELVEDVKNMLKEPSESSDPVEEPSSDSSVEPESEPTAKPSEAATPSFESREEAYLKTQPKAIQPPTEEQPNLPPAEENQEAEEPEEKPFSVIDAVTNIFTGKKAGPSAPPEKSVYPVVTLHSILKHFDLKGTVKVPPGYTLKNIEVYLIDQPYKKKPAKEFYLLTHQIPAKADPEKESLLKRKPLLGGPASPGANPAPAKTAAPASPQGAASGGEEFSLKLPELKAHQSYHLQFTAKKNEGKGLSYKHIYELTSTSPAVTVNLQAATAAIEIEGESDNAIPVAPQFAWEPVQGAQNYRVQLTSGTGMMQKVVWEAWTKNTRVEYPFKRLNSLREREIYHVSVSAFKGLKAVGESKDISSAHPAYRAVWTDLTVSTHTPFEVVDINS